MEKEEKKNTVDWLPDSRETSVKHKSSVEIQKKYNKLKQQMQSEFLIN